MQLSRVEPRLKSGHKPFAHYLTRETADKEQQEKQREIDRLRKALDDQKAKLDEKDRQNRELEDQRACI